MRVFKVMERVRVFPTVAPSVIMLRGVKRLAVKACLREGCLSSIRHITANIAFRVERHIPTHGQRHTHAHAHIHTS